MTNPSLSVECPHCGLLTARFIDHCRNCGYKLWPSSVMAAAAFKVWRDADPSRAMASRFDPLLVVGGLIFLYGVVGWVLVEDVRMYPVETPPTEEAHH